MDTSSKRLRFVSANALASLYLSVHADKPTDGLTDTQVAEPKRKRPASSIKDEHEEPDGRASPVPSRAATSAPFRIDFSEILRQLSILYARSSTKYVRSGVIQTYSIVLKQLGPKFVKVSYSTILEHLLSEVSTHPLVVTDRYRLIQVRDHIQFLLGHVIRRQLLDEPGKMTAIRVLTRQLDPKNPTRGSKVDGLSTEATIAAITELCCLVQDLGSAVSLEQVIYILRFCDVFRRCSTKFLRSSSNIPMQLFRQSLRGDSDRLSSPFHPNLTLCFRGPGQRWTDIWRFSAKAIRLMLESPSVLLKVLL